MTVDEQQHVALPSLYGAPAYARPAVAVAEAPRPFNPDDLPIVAAMSDEELASLDAAPASGQAAPPDHAALRPKTRPFLLRRLAERLRGPRG